MIDAAEAKKSSPNCGEFCTSSELVNYRLKHLGLWREYVGKKVVLA
jgi:hypothetical protein